MPTQLAVVHYALAPNAVELRDVPVPVIEPDDVLLEVGAVSVCGSDVHQFSNTQSWQVNVPVVLGHEFSGTVAGAGRSVRGLREGDRVVSETAAPQDIIVVEILGLAAAGISAARSIRGIRGSSERYGVPVALAVLKLPSGALTAFLGLLLKIVQCAHSFCI